MTRPGRHQSRDAWRTRRRIHLLPISSIPDAPNPAIHSQTPIPNSNTTSSIPSPPCRHPTPLLHAPTSPTTSLPDLHTPISIQTSHPPTPLPPHRLAPGCWTARTVPRDRGGS